MPWAFLLQELLELLLCHRLPALRGTIHSRDEIISLALSGWTRIVPLAFVVAVVVRTPQIAILAPREPVTPAFLSYLNYFTNLLLKNLLNLFHRLSSRSPPPDFPAVPTSRSLFLFFRRAAHPFSFSTSPTIPLHHHRVVVGRVHLPGRHRRRCARVLSFLSSYFV
jgi:hypothetical protein